MKPRPLEPRPRPNCPVCYSAPPNQTAPILSDEPRNAGLSAGHALECAPHANLQNSHARYRTARALADNGVADNFKHISIDGAFDDWAGVPPAYEDPRTPRAATISRPFTLRTMNGTCTCASLSTPRGTLLPRTKTFSSTPTMMRQRDMLQRAARLVPSC